jgi:hypothetical protein
MILDTCRHLRQGPYNIGRPLIRQPTPRATFSFNFCSYLKIRFDTYPFIDNQMKEPENEATQYESPNEGSGTAGSSDSYESPSPPQLPCAKRKRPSGTEDPDYILEQLVYNH